MLKLVKKLTEAVEELLNYHGVKLPDENRQGDPDEACLFGKSLYALEDRFKEIISESGLYEGTVGLTDIFFMNFDKEDILKAIDICILIRDAISCDNFQEELKQKKALATLINLAEDYYVKVFDKEVKNEVN